MSPNENEHQFHQRLVVVVLRRFSPVALVLVRAIAVFVVLAIVIFITANVLGLHLHVLPDGRVVVHSHPVDGGDEGKSQHQHTEHEYAVLSALGGPLQVHSLEAGWSMVCIEPVSPLIEFSGESVISPVVARSDSNRSPPIVISN